MGVLRMVVRVVGTPRLCNERCANIISVCVWAHGCVRDVCREEGEKEGEEGEREGEKRRGEEIMKEEKVEIKGIISFLNYLFSVS